MSIIVSPLPVATDGEVFVGQPLPACIMLPVQRPLPEAPRPDSLPGTIIRANPHAARVFVQLLEIFHGRRHVGQLHQICEGQALRTATRLSRLTRWDDARLASVHSCELSDRIIEASARIRTGDRSVAWALRLELRTRWLATRFETGMAPPHSSVVRPDLPYRDRP